jgi:hypothetical protein
LVPLAAFFVALWSRHLDARTRDVQSAGVAAATVRCRVSDRS